VVFADQVSRVELGLEDVQDRQEAHERGHQPKGQARSKWRGVPWDSFGAGQLRYLPNYNQRRTDAL
jgi:hypothetical protein